MLLLSPKVEMAKDYQVPRDMVLVLDTSGSMRGVKMEQARKALKYCLNNLSRKDRFAIINFATTVNRYRDNLLEANQEQIDDAKKWVDKPRSDRRHRHQRRPADGPGLCAPRTRAVPSRSSSSPTASRPSAKPTSTRSSRTRWRRTRPTRASSPSASATTSTPPASTSWPRRREAVSTYVRPAEDIEAKVSGLYDKISHPVLTNLKLTAGDNGISCPKCIRRSLPDLFHGGQLVVMGRYNGNGPAAIKLTGKVGKEKKEFVYEMHFPDEDRRQGDFVEHLWARRKVGYLLDQIRANGEKKELVEEVMTLAKKYGITTPYTSWLIVPDGPVPVAHGARRSGPYSSAIWPSTRLLLDR